MILKAGPDADANHKMSDEPLKGMTATSTVPVTAGTLENINNAVSLMCLSMSRFHKYFPLLKEEGKGGHSPLMLDFIVFVTWKNDFLNLDMSHCIDSERWKHGYLLQGHICKCYVRYQKQT